MEHHNNARLRQFLDAFGFDYVFKSSTQCYREGLFDPVLLAVLRHYNELLNVMLPTLGPERRTTYSPFLPVSPKTGKIPQVPILAHDAGSDTIVFQDEDGTTVETSVTGGHCKLQWKCDWAMRWVALAVDYEMAGKDLLDSVQISSRMCRMRGGRPPNTLIYEMFLDERGAKISKSKGNGIAVERCRHRLRHERPPDLRAHWLLKPVAHRYFSICLARRCLSGWSYQRRTGHAPTAITRSLRLGGRRCFTPDGFRHGSLPGGDA